MITNARSAPPTEAGNTWHDRTIEDAAKIADVLGPSWKKLQLTRDRNPERARKTPTPTTWSTPCGPRAARESSGAAPGSDHPGELTPEQKVGRLEEYLARKGGFSDAQGPLEIDIRHWKEITARPLSEDGAIPPVTIRLVRENSDRSRPAAHAFPAREA